MVIPKQAQKSVFKLRESCRISAIASAFIFLILRHLRSLKLGALARLKKRFLSLFGYRKLFLIAIFLFPFTMFPVNILLEGKARYFIPINHRFQEIYSGGGIYGIDMSFQAWKSLYPLISLDYFQKSGRSILDDGFNEIKNEKTEVQFLPLGIGVKYVHRVISRVDLYGTLGATATYLHIKDDYENRSHVFANWGPGFTVKLGSLVTINKGLFLDFALEYFYARVHFSKPLIPAHLDGIALGGGAGYRF